TVQRHSQRDADGDADSHVLAVEVHHPASRTIAAPAASSIAAMRSAAPFWSARRAPGPATIRSVCALTEPAARAPRRSACALASSRLMGSRPAVETIVFHAHYL